MACDFARFEGVNHVSRLTMINGTPTEEGGLKGRLPGRKRKSECDTHNSDHQNP